jgi:ADP-heptose:LPS heptosyltransferase
VSDSPTDRVTAPETARSILILDPCPMEEAVLSTPAYSAIAARYPEARHALVTLEENARLLRGDPHLEEVIGVPPGRQFGDWASVRTLRLVFLLRKQKYDLAIDLTGDARMAGIAALLGIPVRIGPAGETANRHLTHAVPIAPGIADPIDRKLSLLESLGCPTRRRQPVLIPSRGDEQYVLDLLRGTGLDARGRFLLVSPSPRWPLILPPPVLASVLDGIAAQRPSPSVFFAGTPTLKDYIDATVSLARVRPSVLFLSPGHFVAFAAIADLVVGGEGLLSLLATAAGARVIGVYSGTGVGASLPVAAASVTALVREGLAAGPPQARRTLKRRRYEQDGFRRSRGDANLFLHTAP